MVAKKSIPRAVDRNRVKRVLREFIRQNGSKFEGEDIAVWVKGAAAERKNVELFSELKSYLA